MFFSFIIPVYNVEHYLEECIDSVLKQKYIDYEIILVDDGSTDRCGMICDEYGRKYDFINVIHKENGGLSDARNVGLSTAKGEFVLFVDSDDYIGENTLAKIANCIKSQKKEVDLVFLEGLKVFPDKKIVPLGDGYIAESINGCTKIEVMTHLAELPKYPGSACTKAIRRKLIVDNKIYFKKGLLSEDIDWTISLLNQAETFAYCDVNYYYYRQNRRGSITNTSDIKRVMDLFYIIKKWSSRNSGKDYQNQINAFMAYEYMILLYVYSALENEERKKIIHGIKEYSWVLQYGKSRKTKLTYYSAQILGIHNTALLLNKYKQMML